jgi:hypothetical protein
VLQWLQLRRSKNRALVDGFSRLNATTLRRCFRTTAIPHEGQSNAVCCMSVARAMFRSGGTGAPKICSPGRSSLVPWGDRREAVEGRRPGLSSTASAAATVDSIGRERANELLQSAGRPPAAADVWRNATRCSPVANVARARRRREERRNIVGGARISVVPRTGQFGPVLQTMQAVCQSSQLQAETAPAAGHGCPCSRGMHLPA